MLIRDLPDNAYKKTWNNNLNYKYKGKKKVEAK